MAYGDDIDGLNAGHRYNLDGDANDALTANNGTNSGGLFTGVPLTRDATNSWITNGLSDRITLPGSATNINGTMARKCVAGWYMNTGFQAPPTRIYGEGTTTTCYQIVMGFGNNSMFEVVEPTNFPNGLQIYGPALVPFREYHFCGIFSGNAHDNEVKFFVDGVEQTDAQPSDRQPDTADLNSRSPIEIGDPAGAVGIGGGTVIQQATRNGAYQYWSMWGDSADALLSNNDVRVILFERGALANTTVISNTEVNMQTYVDTIADQDNAACCIEVEEVTGGGDFSLTSNVVFDSLSSIHVRYNGNTSGLTWINIDDGNASIGSAPFGGIITLATRQTLTVTVLDAANNAVIEGARVYIEADSGGDLSTGTEIMNTTTNSSGVATATHDYTSDQPIIARVRKTGSSPYYKTGEIGGPLTSIPLNETVLVVPDE